MSAEVAEAIRQTRRTLAEKTWVPYLPTKSETCLATALPGGRADGPTWNVLCDVAGMNLVQWNDRQTDVGAVLGMTLQALIAELCKPTLAQSATEA